MVIHILPFTGTTHTIRAVTVMIVAGFAVVVSAIGDGAEPKAPEEVSGTNAPTQALLNKGTDTLRLIRAAEGKADGRKLFEVRLGRIIVALGEYGQNTKASIEFLREIESDRKLQAVRLPDWLVFVDEYQRALERLGSSWPEKAVQPADANQFEAEADFNWGLDTGYTLSLLAHKARTRLEGRVPVDSAK